MNIPRSTARFPTSERSGQRGFSLLELLITAVLLLILSFMMMGRGMWSDQKRELMTCQKNLQNIYVALNIYAADNKGNYPIVSNAETSEAPLSLLVPRSTSVTEMFICPGSKDRKLPEGEPFAKRRISYAYYMGRLRSDGPDAPLVSDRQVNAFPKIKRQLIFSENGKPPANNHRKSGGNFLFCDGQIKTTKPRATVDLTFSTNVVLLNPRP